MKRTHLVESLPVWIVAALVGGAVCGTLVGKRILWIALAAIGGAVIAGLVVRNTSFGNEFLPVQSYGVAMLTGFLAAVWTCQRRMPAIGVAPHHVLDMGVMGVIVGLLGARTFHVLMNWADYNPGAGRGISILKPTQAHDRTLGRRAGVFTARC